jgi:hypothetical protein
MYLVSLTAGQSDGQCGLGGEVPEQVIVPQCISKRSPAPQTLFLRPASNRDWVSCSGCQLGDELCSVRFSDVPAFDWASAQVLALNPKP